MKRLHRKLLGRMDIAAAMDELLGEAEGGNHHCPFADERHERGTDSKPSFSVSPDKGGACFCHSCGYRASSVVGLVQDLDGVEYREAIESLWSRFVSPLVPSSEVDRAHATLMSSPLKLTQLEERRGLSRGTVRRRRLGWRGNRLWIPVTDENGLVVDVRRHAVFGVEGDAPKILSYKKGYGAARLYPVDAAKGRRSVVLVEGEVDALLLCQRGVPAVTLTSGAMTMPAEVAKKFKDVKVLVVGDNDKAGRRGAAKRARAINEAGGDAQVVKLPVDGEKEDVGDWILKYGGRAKSIWKLAKSAPEPEPETEAGTLEIDIGELSPQEAKLLLRADTAMRELMSSGRFITADGETVYQTEGAAIAVNASPHGPLALMLNRRFPHINPATASGRFVLHHVVSHVPTAAESMKSAAWSYYDRRRNAVYVWQRAGRLVRATARRASLRRNPCDGVLMVSPSRDEMTFRYRRGVKPDWAVRRFWELVAANVACAEDDRYLVSAWLMGAFMRELVQAKPQLRLMAPSGSGKSTASKLISAVMLGSPTMQTSATTMASAWSSTSRDPLVIWDNLESDAFSPAMLDYFAIASTGGGKSKRAPNTVSGVVHERLNSLILTNGIEPYSKNEIISRTMEVAVDSVEFGREGFSETAAMMAILDERDAVLSGLVNMIRADVLPRVAAGELSRITSEIRGHELSRFNEYLSLMAIVVDAFLAYVPSDEYTQRGLFKAWIKRQAELSRVTKLESNPVVEMLNLLSVRYADLQNKRFCKIEESRDRIRITGQAQSLLHDFESCMREQNRRPPFKDSATLGRRISDSVPAIVEAGWSYSRSTVNGRAVHKLSKKLEED